MIHYRIAVITFISKYILGIKSIYKIASTCVILNDS